MAQGKSHAGEEEGCECYWCESSGLACEKCGEDAWERSGERDSERVEESMIPPKLRDKIERWIREKKYGNIQINFSGGKIVNVNRTESFKVEVIWVDAPKATGDASFNVVPNSIAV